MRRRTTLAVVHQGRESLQSYLGVVRPNQQAPECQAALKAQIHSLVILYLQLRNNEDTVRTYRSANRSTTSQSTESECEANVPSGRRAAPSSD